MLSIVLLNVGGTIFQTRKTTLLQSEYFKILLDDEKFGDGCKNNDGSYFIDEDPELFKHLLNKLRHPDYEFPNLLNPGLNKLASFYMIPSVKNLSDQPKKIVMGKKSFTIINSDDFKSYVPYSVGIDKGHTVTFDGITIIDCITFTQNIWSNIYCYDENNMVFHLDISQRHIIGFEAYKSDTKLIDILSIINKYKYNKIVLKWTLPSEYDQKGCYVEILYTTFY